MVQENKYGPIEAFEEYYKMGETRSLRKLELKLKNVEGRKGPSLRTLKGWSAKYEWQEQKGARNGELRRALAEKTTKEISEYKTEFLKKVERVIATGFERDGTPIVTCEKVRDLKDLVEVSLKLMGEEREKETTVQINIRKYEPGKEEDG